MVNEGFKGLVIAGLAGFVLIVSGVATLFFEEWIADILNVETIRFVSTPLIIFGAIIFLVVVFFVLLLWDRSG